VYPKGFSQAGQPPEKVSKLKQFLLMKEFFKAPKTRKILEDQFSTQAT